MGEKRYTGVKIQKNTADKINNFVEDKHLEYRTFTDFVNTAISKEIELCTYKQQLSPANRFYFDRLLSNCYLKCYEKAIGKEWDAPGTELNKEKQDLQEELRKKSAEFQDSYKNDPEFNKKLEKSFKKKKN